MEEKHLIEKAQSGDQKCFTELILLHQSKLYKYLLAKCGNEADAKDVLQETYINAYKYIQSYNSKWAFHTWLFTIATRLANKRPLQHVSIEECNDIEGSYESIEYKNSKNNIWHHIRSLVKQQAFDVLWFYYAEERSTKEIAKIMSKSQSWVKITLHRSKKKMSSNSELRKMSEDYLMVS